MACNHVKILAVIAFTLCFLSAESRVRHFECPNGTPTCAHGRCLEAVERDASGRMVHHQHCICDPEYYGKSCSIRLGIEHSNYIVSPSNGRQAHEPEWNDLDEPLNEIHAYGGGAQ